MIVVENDYHLRLYSDSHLISVVQGRFSPQPNRLKNGAFSDPYVKLGLRFSFARCYLLALKTEPPLSLSFFLRLACRLE